MNPAVPQSRAIAPVAFEDGLGERLYAVGAANEPLEVLKISNELSCVSSFEEALREQASRVADFRHEAFGRVRAVERLDARSSTVVVISDHVRGVRLSEVLAGARKRSIPLEYSAAAWLIRQLVSAIAALHDSSPAMCHGAISPERLVVTPDGRLMVVEYILAPALEEMHFSWERYWRELGIALPRPIGLSRFDQAADVTQMAAVALALLLGRPLEADEYPHKISDVLDTATARQANGADPLPAALRTWLRRALHIEPRAAFASALDAQAELDRVLDVSDAGGRLALRGFLSRYAAAVTLERQMAATSKSSAPPVEAKAPASVELPAVPPAPIAAVPAVPPSLVETIAPMVPAAALEPAEPVDVVEPMVPMVPVAELAQPAYEPLAVVAPEPEPYEVPEPMALDELPVPAPMLAVDEPVVDKAADRKPYATAFDADDLSASDDDAEAVTPPSTETPFPVPASFAPPSVPASVPVASVTPFAPRTSAFAAALAEQPADVTMPAPQSGLWAKPGPGLADPLEMEDMESDMPHAAPSPSISESNQPPVHEAARIASGRPAWQSPWAVAAVVVIIAVTTGVTFLGRKAPAAATTAPASSGTLEIGTNPDGVAVFIDGANRGTTPLTVSLAPGAHDVELVTDTDRRKVPVTMKAGAHMSHFIEMPKTVAGAGDLVVRTDPSKAKVTVDGKLYGRSPVTVKGLTAGTHRVLLENESGTFSDDVVIEAGATASLVVPMTTAKPQVGAVGANVSGWIAISTPADVQVFEGGRLVGSSRTDRIMVAVGRHDLEMVNEALGYRSTKSVEVSAGQVATVRPDWPKGTMAVNALPWAEVSIDGERVGETPIGSVSVPIGTHEIVFRHPDLGERRSMVTVTAGAAARVSMDMRAK
jgi:hypothetical protein